MGSPLVESLDAIEKRSAKEKKETAHYLTHDGKIISKVKGTKSGVTMNSAQMKKLKLMGKKIIITHNHPYPYDSSLTKNDMRLAIYNDSDGVRAVTKKYTYVAYRPKNGWRINCDTFDILFDDAEKYVTKVMQKAYDNGKITNKQYKDLFTHKIMERCCKKAGIKYFRFEN